MSNLGLTIKQDSTGKRIKLNCQHQNGLIYVVSSEANWVCSDELSHVHSLAGFFKELATLKDPRVSDAMQRWGLYYRDLPVEEIP